MGEAVMEDYEKKIISIACNKPILPVDVARSLGIDLLMASAFISELVGNGKLFISSIRIGSSPLYYLPDKRHLLEGFCDHLNEKDKRSLEFLKKNKVVRESAVDPLTRVGLRHLKDFSVPLEVHHNDKTEIFWKYYDVDDKEAENIVRQILNIPSTNKPQKAEKQSCLSDNANVEDFSDKEKSSDAGSSALVDAAFSDEVLKKIYDFFQQHNTKVIEESVVKKKKEYEFVVEIKTSLGILSYYCKYLNKKRVGPPDINNAIVAAQTKKLPILLITPGTPTKKVREILEEMKGIIFQQTRF